MKLHRTVLASILAASAAAALVAGPNENATLNAAVNPGSLEIVPASVNGPHSPTSGAVSVTGFAQTDAVTFAIDGITINDLNGDGLGWNLTATPGNLTFGSSTMTVGTTGGFNNPSNAGPTTINTVNDVSYSASAVANFTIDYDIAYTVPAFAEAGTYTGVIAFAIVAE